MNRIVKLTVVMSVAFFTLTFFSVTAFRSVAYEAPQDIHLLIETKEINIKDIPENRTVSIDIYTENCPPYLMLSFLLEKDKRLEYMPYKYLTDEGQVSNMSGMSFELGSSEKTMLFYLLRTMFIRQLIRFRILKVLKLILYHIRTQ